ncbi:MAG: hypothetical protein ABI851_07300 [Saprospiraceae bacterium]
MKNLILKFVALYAIALLSLTSCQKEESSSTVENFVNDAVYQLQDVCGLGKLGCFELIFPVTLQFPDNSTQTFTSYEELQTGLRMWRKSNPDIEGRPEFVFPIDVLKKDGTTISVNSKDELVALRKDCPGNPRRGPKGHIARGLHCFDLVFPITLVLPNNTEKTINSQDELKAALKAWRESKLSRKDGHPVFKFPFSVTLKADGTSVLINSKEDLIALKDNCR